MKKIIAILVFLAAALMAEEHKVVFSLTTDHTSVLKKRLIHQVELLDAYYAKKHDHLKIAVVIYGEAYRFFLKHPEHSLYANDAGLIAERSRLEKELQNLHERYDVVFDMCGMGMKKRNIDRQMIYPFAHPVYNKNVALIDWQNKGYAYIEVR